MFCINQKNLVWIQSQISSLLSPPVDVYIYRIYSERERKMREKPIHTLILFVFKNSNDDLMIK